MSILDLLNASFNPQYVNSVNYSNGLSKAISAVIKPGENKEGVSGAQNPSFGIKGRQPLTADTFQRSGEKEGTTFFMYKGRKLSKEDAQRKSHSDVEKHEAAHLAKAGKYATTGICIDKDSNGIAVSGHVGVSMPKLDKRNPDETIAHAKAVIASAEAPASFDELSDADRSVAAAGRATLAEAQSFKAQNKYNNADNPFRFA